MSQRRINLLSFVLLAGATSAVYFQSLNSPFIFDDSGSVLRNRSIVRLWPLIGDSEYPGPLNPPKDHPTSGRPLVNFTLAVNYYFGQLNPVGYHAFNLVVHVLSALLLLGIVRRTLRLEYFGGRFDDVAEWLALAVALLWAVHPLQTETVIYITQRTELMVGFFYLATLYGSLRYWAAASPAGRKTWLVLSTLACLAGMASKEVMVTAPLIVLLFERTFITGSFRRALKRSWRLYAGLLISWGLLLWLNFSGPRSSTAGFDLGIPAYAWWLTQPKILWLYLKLVVWPWPLAIYYYMPYLTTLGAAWPWLVPTLLLVIATLLLCWRRSPIGFAGAWLLLILSPTMIVPIITEMAAERRMYLPLAALAALAIVGGYALTQRATSALRAADAKRKKPANQTTAVIATSVALFLAVVLGLISVHRLTVFRNELILWQDVLATQPKNFFAHYNLGIQLGLEHRLPEALEEYEEAIRFNPTLPEPYNNSGNALLALGRTEEAIARFKEALRIRPDYARAHNNFGTALATKNKIDEAIEEYQTAIKLDPEMADADNNLGKLLITLNRPQEAVEHFKLAVQHAPNDFDAHANLGGVLVSLGQFEEAVEYCRQALRIRPDNTEAHCNLGLALAKLGKFPEAVAEYQQALRLDPNDFNARYNFGNVLFEAGQVPAAVEQFQQAIQSNPNDAQARYNLGNALLQIGQREDAIDQFQTAVKIKPDYAEAHNNLGSTLLRAGRSQEAIEQYQQTVQLMPNHPKAYNNLANAFAQMQRFGEAIAAAQKALDLARSTGQADLAEQIEIRLKNYRAEQAKDRGESATSSRDRAAP